MDNVSELKKKLTELGISTSTPGVYGDDRLEELNLRLELSSNGKNVSGSKKSSSTKVYDPFSSSPTKTLSDAPTGVNNLSLAELRGRLAALGENTSTPGISGEERRLELIKRLQKAICGTDSEEDSNNEQEEESEEEEDRTPVEKYNDMPSIIYHRDVVPSPRRVPSPPTEKEVYVRVVDEVIPDEAPSRQPEPEPEPAPDEVLVPVSEKEISELKSQLKRISTKRAVAIANRLSAGSEQQDEELKQAEKLNLRIEAELQRVGSLALRSAKQQGMVNINHNNVSSVLIDSGNAMFTVESLKAKLTALKERTKGEIKVHRQRIREDELNHPEHGIVAEESLNNYLKEVNLNKGRVRRKIELRKQFPGANGEPDSIPRDYPLMSAKWEVISSSSKPGAIVKEKEEGKEEGIKRAAGRNRKAPSAPAPGPRSVSVSTLESAPWTSASGEKGVTASGSSSSSNKGKKKNLTNTDNAADDVYDGSIQPDVINEIKGHSTNSSSSSKVKVSGKTMLLAPPISSKQASTAQYKPKQKSNQAYRILDEDEECEEESEEESEEEDDYMYDEHGNLKPPKQQQQAVVSDTREDAGAAEKMVDPGVGSEVGSSVTDDYIAKELESLRQRKAGIGIGPKGASSDHPYVKFSPMPPPEKPPSYSLLSTPLSKTNVHPVYEQDNADNQGRPVMKTAPVAQKGGANSNASSDALSAEDISGASMRPKESSGKEDDNDDNDDTDKPLASPTQPPVVSGLQVSPLLSVMEKEQAIAATQAQVSDDFLSAMLNKSKSRIGAGAGVHSTINRKPPSGSPDAGRVEALASSLPTSPVKIVAPIASGISVASCSLPKPVVTPTAVATSHNDSDGDDDADNHTHAGRSSDPVAMTNSGGNNRSDDSCSDASDASDSEDEDDNDHDGDSEKRIDAEAPAQKLESVSAQVEVPLKGEATADVLNAGKESLVSNNSSEISKIKAKPTAPMNMNDLMAEVLSSSNAELERMQAAKANATAVANKMEIAVLEQSKQLVALGVLQEGDEDAASLDSPPKKKMDMFRSPESGSVGSGPGFVAGGSGGRGSDAGESNASPGSTMSSPECTPRSPRDTMALLARIKGLLRQANVYWDIHGDVKRADKCYTKALSLDPTNLVTLTNYATFLHRKMGESMNRVEALYKRGIQICLPDLLESLEAFSSPRRLFDRESPAKFQPPTTQPPRPGSSGNVRNIHNDDGLAASTDPRPPPNHAPNTASHTKLSHLINLLCSYASFLQRAKGDLEAAGLVYVKAMSIDSNNGHLLRQFAHYLSGEEFKLMKEVQQYHNRRAEWEEEKRNRIANGEAVSDEAWTEAPPQEALSMTVTGGWGVDQLYSMALKRDRQAGRENPATILGYGKYLRKVGKLSQAELMYSVAFKLMSSCAEEMNLDGGGMDEDGNNFDAENADAADGGGDNGNQREKRQELVAKYKPMAICNYATFLFERHRRAYAQGPTQGGASFRDAEDGVRRAREMFTDGLAEYPKHRGLQKNYKLFVKSMQQLEDRAQMQEEIEAQMGANVAPQPEVMTTPEKVGEQSAVAVNTDAGSENRQDGFSLGQDGMSSSKTHSAVDAKVIDSSGCQSKPSHDSVVVQKAVAPSEAKSTPRTAAATSKGKVPGTDSKATSTVASASKDKVKAKTIAAATEPDSKTKRTVQSSAARSGRGTAKRVQPSSQNASVAAVSKATTSNGTKDKAAKGATVAKSTAAAAASVPKDTPIPTVEEDDFNAEYGVESNHNDLAGLWSSFGGIEED